MVCITYVCYLYITSCVNLMRSTLEEDQLVLQQRRMDDRNLNPGAVDTFAGGGLEVSFERERAGRVIGLYMSSGRTRGVRFERVN